MVIWSALSHLEVLVALMLGFSWFLIPSNAWLMTDSSDSFSVMILALVWTGNSFGDSVKSMFENWSIS